MLVLATTPQLNPWLLVHRFINPPSHYQPQTLHLVYLVLASHLSLSSTNQILTRCSLIIISSLKPANQQDDAQKGYSLFMGLFQLKLNYLLLGMSN